MTKPLSRKQRQLQDDASIYVANTVKLTSLLILRNQGWGITRLTRFSEKFDELLVDVNEERLTFSDIAIALEEELSLKHKAFLIKAR